MRKPIKISPLVETVKATRDYTLLLTIRGGARRIYNARPLLTKGIYAPLKNIDLFLTARVECGTVVWNDDIDIAPEHLWDVSLPISEEEWEDMIDVAVAEEAYAEYMASGCKSTPADELWKELGLDDEDAEVDKTLQEAEREAELTDQRYSSGEVYQAMQEAIQGKLTFKSNLTTEAIEHNFEAVGLFSEIKAGLEEALEYTKGNLTAYTRTLTIEDEPQMVTDEATDPFSSERNMEFLRRGIEALDAGEGVEHELLEAKLVNEGLADIENGKTVDGDSVRARMAGKYGV